MSYCIFGVFTRLFYFKKFWMQWSHVDTPGGKRTPAKKAISSGNLLVRVRKHNGQKGIKVLFSITKYYNLISITVLLTNLQEADRGWLHPHTVCLNPLLCLLIKPRSCQNAQFSPWISLACYSSSVDLENVCSPKRLLFGPWWNFSSLFLPGKWISVHNQQAGIGEMITFRRWWWW